MAEYWTTAEAAEFAHHAPGTLEYWRGQGKGPQFVKLPSGRVLYRAADVVAWMEGEVQHFAAHELAAWTGAAA
ncbi:helix-turn-helix transcriptional regulator [Propionicimonas paludicola]|nr:helix-turn-helix domain-containing protein [Propionicimonas paludicola]